MRWPNSNDLRSEFANGFGKALTAMDGFVEEIENEIVATWASLNKE
jgi:hypothetical protein